MPEQRTAWLSAAAFAVAALVVLVLWLAVAILRQPGSKDAGYDAALAAARQAVVDFATVDYRHPRASMDRLRAESTGSLMTRQINALVKAAVPFIRSNKEESTAQVLAAGVAETKGNRVAVVAAVDQSFHSTPVPGGGVHRYRFLVILTKVHGRWLVSNLQPT